MKLCGYLWFCCIFPGILLSWARELSSKGKEGPAKAFIEGFCILYYVALYNTILYYTIRYSLLLYYTILYYIIFCYTILMEAVLARHSRITGNQRLYQAQATRKTCTAVQPGTSVSCNSKMSPSIPPTSQNEDQIRPVWTLFWDGRYRRGYLVIP